jgi:hypothetical protein
MSRGLAVMAKDIYYKNPANYYNISQIEIFLVNLDYKEIPKTSSLDE